MTALEECFGPEHEPVLETLVDRRCAEYERTHPQVVPAAGSLGLHGAAAEQVPAPRPEHMPAEVPAVGGYSFVAHA